jgi:hypothetical protein
MTRFSAAKQSKPCDENALIKRRGIERYCSKSVLEHKNELYTAMQSNSSEKLMKLANHSRNHSQILEPYEGGGIVAG